MFWECKINYTTKYIKTIGHGEKLLLQNCTLSSSSLSDSEIREKSINNSSAIDKNESYHQHHRLSRELEAITRPSPSSSSSSTSSTQIATLNLSINENSLSEGHRDCLNLNSIETKNSKSFETHSAECYRASLCKNVFEAENGHHQKYSEINEQQKKREKMRSDSFETAILRKKTTTIKLESKQCYRDQRDQKIKDQNDGPVMISRSNNSTQTFSNGYGREEWKMIGMIDIDHHRKLPEGISSAISSPIELFKPQQTFDTKHSTSAIMTKTMATTTTQTTTTAAAAASMFILSTERQLIPFIGLRVRQLKQLGFSIQDWYMLMAKIIIVMNLIVPQWAHSAMAMAHHQDDVRSKTLYIAGFFPTSRNIPQGAIGRGVLPAVRLALQHVNESPLFTKYRLDLVWNNTKCDAAYGMKAFFRMLDEEPIKILLFGGACPSVTDPIAKTSKFFHLIQLSYADTFTATTSNFFRIVPSEGSFNPARVKLLKFFNWTKVGTIYQNSPRYSLPHSKLLTDLDNAEIEILASQSITDEIKPETYLQTIKSKDVRIIVGNFGEEYGRKIFCQAYKEGIYGRRYQWIITGIYEENWWQLNDEQAELLGCTEDQLLEAINGYISTDVLPLSKNKKTYYGFETSLYKSEYDRLRLKEYSRFHGYAYDSIWTIALAIQTVDKKLRMINSPLTLEDFHYRDPFWAQLFREALNETNFVGVTDHVSFDIRNERRGIVLLQQFQSDKLLMTDIAQYFTSSDDLVFENNQIDWRGGNGPPVDRNTVVIKPSRISMTLFIVISVFAIIGIIIAFVFLAMNIKYRNQRYIKMSSPYLNNLIIIGCILTYTSVILLGLNSGLTSEHNFPYICASRAWVLMTGFTLAFGSMFSKTWRVHAIFTDIKLNKKLIKDYKLFMVVGVLVFIDVATLTTWQIVDPFYRVTNQGKPEPSPQNEDILVIPEMEYCQSKRMTIFLGSIYVYKGLLMAFGIFLAWETRHVSIPALNDSKYIGMSVYNVVIMCVIGAGVSFVLRDQQDAAFVIISAFIIFCSTATLCLVFVPKLIELKRNPNAGDRRVRATLKPFKKSHHHSEEIEIHTKIKLANEENFRLRQRLKEKSYELEALTFRLRALEESTIKELHSEANGKFLILPSKSPLGPLSPSSSKHHHEIIVEKNDLKQIDCLDQRKLSAASLKVFTKPNQRRKSSVIQTQFGPYEIQEETSTSPTEVIVNSTSILSLSSEAAQLTVKNDDNYRSHDEHNCSRFCSKTRQSTAQDDDNDDDDENDEENDDDEDEDDDEDDDDDDDDDDENGSSNEIDIDHLRIKNQRKNIVNLKKNLNSDDNGDCDRISGDSQETSDDTSYAKAIKQRIVSDDVEVPPSTSAAILGDISMSYCSTTASLPMHTSTIGSNYPPVHLHHCCHHHLHHHHCAGHHHCHHTHQQAHHLHHHHHHHPYQPQQLEQNFLRQHQVAVCVHNQSIPASDQDSIIVSKSHHHHHHQQQHFSIPMSATSIALFPLGIESDSNRSKFSDNLFAKTDDDVFTKDVQKIKSIDNVHHSSLFESTTPSISIRSASITTTIAKISTNQFDQTEQTDNSKVILDSHRCKNNQDHNHDENCKIISNQNKDDNIDDAKQSEPIQNNSRRTLSCGDLLYRSSIYESMSKSEIIDQIDQKTIIVERNFDQLVPFTFESILPTTSIGCDSMSYSFSSNRLNYDERCNHLQHAPLSSSSTTSLANCLRPHYFETNAIGERNQLDRLGPNSHHHYRSLSIDPNDLYENDDGRDFDHHNDHHHINNHRRHQQQQRPFNHQSISDLDRNSSNHHDHHHHHHRHLNQHHSQHQNLPDRRSTTLRSGQSCPHVRCDIVEYF